MAQLVSVEVILVCTRYSHNISAPFHQARIQKDVEGGAMWGELPSIRGFAYLPGGAPAARPSFRGGRRPRRPLPVSAPDSVSSVQIVVTHARAIQTHTRFELTTHGRRGSHLTGFDRHKKKIHITNYHRLEWTWTNSIWRTDQGGKGLALRYCTAYH